MFSHPIDIAGICGVIRQSAPIIDWGVSQRTNVCRAGGADLLAASAAYSAQEMILTCIRVSA